MAKVLITIDGQINHIEIERYPNGNVVFTSDFVACGNTGDSTIMIAAMNGDQPKELIEALIKKDSNAIVSFLEEMKEGGKLEFGEIQNVEFEIMQGEAYEIFFAFYESNIRAGIIKAYEQQNTTDTQYFELYANGKANHFNRSGAWSYAPDAEEPIFTYAIEASTMSDILSNTDNLDESGKFDAAYWVDFMIDTQIQDRINLIIEEETQKYHL